MRKTDPIFISQLQPKDKIIFAVRQDLGSRTNQEDVFTNYKDECFVLADGVGGMPHGREAAQLTAETAIWGYKQIRLRPFYWEDKKLFMKRIFRSVNIAVWQKHRETGYSGGLASTLVVLMISTRTIWLGSIGDTSVWLSRGGNLKKLTVEDRDNRGNLTKAIGLDRYGLVPQFATSEFTPGDNIILATDGVAEYITDKDLNATNAGLGESEQSVQQSSMDLIKLAKNNGSEDNMTVAIIKRVSLLSAH